MTDVSPWHEDHGFKYQLFPAKTGKAKSVVIYMHGVDDYAHLPDDQLKYLQDKVPDADVILLQAPMPVEKSSIYPEPKGYTWFPYGGSVVKQVKAWVAHIFNKLPVANQVEAFAHAQLAQRGLNESNLAYYGHSMGGIMALEAGLTGKHEVAAIVTCSSVVPPFTHIHNHSKVFLQMGEVDPLFNQPRKPLPEKGFLKKAFTFAMNNFGLRHELTKLTLEKAHVPFTEKIYPGMGHVQTYETWVDGVNFIAKALAKPAA